MDFTKLLHRQNAIFAFGALNTRPDERRGVVFSSYGVKFLSITLDSIILFE